MRHAEAGEKVPREIGFIGNERRRRFAGKILEVAAEVGLVVIAARESGLDPAIFIRADNTEDLNETLHAAKELGRQADARVETALELAGAAGAGGAGDG